MLAIPVWTEKPGRLQSTGLQRVGHDIVTEQKQQKAPQTAWHIIGFH